VQGNEVTAQNLRHLQQMQRPARILLVEGNPVTRKALASAAASFAQVDSHGSFETARARLYSAPFDLLVTNIRLGAYNGLHLVYLGSTIQPTPHAIVYSDERDAGLAREVHRAGAFYEVGTSLPVTLAGYLRGTLPDHDRRDPVIPDRRRRFRGGRRSWDIHHAKSSGAGGTPEAQASHTWSGSM